MKQPHTGAGMCTGHTYRLYRCRCRLFGYVRTPDSCGDLLIQLIQLGGVVCSIGYAQPSVQGVPHQRCQTPCIDANHYACAKVQPQMAKAQAQAKLPCQ